MARAPRRSRVQPPLVASHFQDALVLNQYLISLFGIDRYIRMQAARCGHWR